MTFLNIHFILDVVVESTYIDISVKIQCRSACLVDYCQSIGVTYHFINGR